MAQFERTKFDLLFQELKRSYLLCICIKSKAAIFSKPLCLDYHLFFVPFRLCFEEHNLNVVHVLLKA